MQVCAPDLEWKVLDDFYDVDEELIQHATSGGYAWAKVACEEKADAKHYLPPLDLRWGA